MKSRAAKILVAIFCFASAVAGRSHAADDPLAGIKRVADATVRPMMVKDAIPGMALGIILAGKSYVFNYGVESKQSRRPVTRDTLFELGSVTKTLTATLTSYAQVNGHLSLSDKTAVYLPSLRGSPFGALPLVNLGTHTPGGLPLQVPDDVRNDDQLMRYFKSWHPTYAPGTYRTYSNLGIGALGLITAKSMHQDFVALMERRLFPALGMNSSFIEVPASRADDYAQGYTEAGTPVRMATGELSSEAYGVKTTAADMVRFLQANMHLVEIDDKLQQAITDTHIGYFKAGPMIQDLIWEQYPFPVALNELLDGNSTTMIFSATPVTKIQPPQKPREAVWINKTGSTNGFGAYVAFVPEKRLGIVILANKTFSIADRVAAAYDILTALAAGER